MTSITNVSTAEGLYQALEKANGGETILLESGTYEDFSLSAKNNFNVQFASEVTVRSADSDDPAVFHKIALKGVENLTLDGLVFDYGFETGDINSTRPFSISGSSGISVVNSVFDGDRANDGVQDEDGFGIGVGLIVQGSNDVTVENSEFFHFHRGLIVNESQDVVVKGNEVHEIRSDGLNFIDVQRVLIKENHIHNFRAHYESGDHRDMIQFWTNGTDSPSTDIVIRDNTLDIGDGSFSQAIFMRNEVVDSQGGGQEMFYQNILIEQNSIYGGHLHGITVGETNGLTIRDNTLIAIEDANNPDQNGSTVWVPAINIKVNSQDVTVDSNVTFAIEGFDGQEDWNVKNNVFVQNSDPFGVGYYEDVFVTSSMTLGLDGHLFVAKPGSIVDNLGADAEALHDAPILAEGRVLFEVESTDTGENSKVFNAELTQTMLAQEGIEDASYTWTFADGRVATGVVVEHDFTHSGHHDVRLVVTLPDGLAYDATTVVGVRGGQLLSFDGEDRMFKIHGFGEQAGLDTLAAVQDGALNLGATGTVASVSRSWLDGLRGSDELDLGFTIEGSGTGEIFRMHGSFITSVNDTGELEVLLFNRDHITTKLTTSGLAVNDAEVRDISITVAEGLAALMVDGQAVDVAAFEGTFPTAGSWDLVFGNPWGKQNFDGKLSAFDVSAGAHLESLDRIPAQTVESHAGFKHDSMVQLVNETASLRLEGNEDSVNFGRLEDFEDSNAIGVEVDFTIDTDNGAESRLVWNHMNVGITLKDDNILVHAATADGEFQAFEAKGLHLARGPEHSAMLLIDGNTDQLQLIVNDEVVLNITDVDFDFVGADAQEWGWSVGTIWNRPFAGEVSSLIVSDEFTFVSDDAFMLPPIDDIW